VNDYPPVAPADCAIQLKGTGGPIIGVLIGAAAPIAITIEFPPGFMFGFASSLQLPVIQMLPDGSNCPAVNPLKGVALVARVGRYRIADRLIRRARLGIHVKTLCDSSAKSIAQGRTAVSFTAHSIRYFSLNG